MTDTTAVDPSVVGTIAPAPDGSARPVFQVLRHKDADVVPNVRACEHKQYVLDDRWKTVTCQDCGERVDAFAALMNFALWWEDLERERKSLERQHRELLIDRLKNLKGRRDISDQEVAEINQLVRDHAYELGKIPAGERIRILAEAEFRIERAINERRSAKRRDRKSSQRSSL